ncbi:hypothetical protein QBC33DRAFT_538703 [Phialemonium atrogriseum]|uniref:Uncharacterized protein n=1 Tax=Phialemonium atrogriseum TaxID=1093897 RepID=A0AAJ0FHD9_9PEZI|nr:uncharacterized protein QBC33DRAFT_538703 [Phialemonium atrogriseum]KAK1767607.1 hypothetical protein QBC33DRAFT_538703 [Phialemonium atrogriseum]
MASGGPSTLLIFLLFLIIGVIARFIRDCVCKTQRRPGEEPAIELRPRNPVTPLGILRAATGPRGLTDLLHSLEDGTRRARAAEEAAPLNTQPSIHTQPAADG